MQSIRLARSLGWLAAILGALWIGIIVYAPIGCPVDVNPVHDVAGLCTSQAQLHATLPFYGLSVGVVPLSILVGLALVGLVAGVTMATGAARLRAVGLLLTWLSTLFLTWFELLSLYFGPWFAPVFVCAVLAAVFSTVRTAPAVPQ